jgi:hypothetical protein
MVVKRYSPQQAEQMEAVSAGQKRLAFAVWQ